MATPAIFTGMFNIYPEKLKESQPVSGNLRDGLPGQQKQTS
jgi:hypothetical protein